ncbi:MAG TPA: FAD-binding oxidoreductase [Hydrogenophaga sp.]|uniref:NAD(P)/FAD-dependent oxidoreductase n=1 Tax=Hydrogenophaga sp. TaxID=1904254 RepID=UPI002C27E7C9|nr:FAD-binding oxidoreductase [Hydrogenophaga sp.]HSX92631.1 FAD-binding oxidoreductase [Hydrogenophaga sp.]
MTGDPQSHGLWAASAPPAPEAPPLQGHHVVDVAIVGAGYTGLSAALHLAEGGASALVLESMDIGFGGSGRNVGLVNAGLWVMPAALPERLGPVHGPRLLQRLGDGPSMVFDLIERHGIDCEAVRQGTLHCAVGASGFRGLGERARQWQALGAPVELMDASAAARLTGTTAYSGALLDRRAGTLQPLAYARGLARAAQAAGAALHAQSPVVAAQDAGTHWRLSTAQGATVDARWVLVGTNAYSASGGPWPRLDEELVRFPYFNLATRPLSDRERATILPQRQGAWDTALVLSSFRLDAAGRLVFGSVGALRGAGRAIHRDWGRRALARLFPSLRGIDFDHGWYGHIGMTCDALPRLHRLARNTWSFSGYNGRGIAPGTVFGREFAQLVLGRCGESDLALPVTPPRAAPLRAAREAGYEWGARAVHLTHARW